MSRLETAVGKRYGRLIVLEKDLSKRKESQQRTRWVCKCDCGTVKSIQAYKLRVGEIKSCGCLRKENAGKLSKRHGKSRYADGTIRPEFNAWVGIKTRCYNKNRPEYERYGGRGIKVCGRWLDSFENFYDDMGERPTDDHSIDRIDNDEDYSPENCRWATHEQQSRNQRLRKDNNTGIRGVRYYKRDKMYHANISINGKNMNLGKFESFSDAAKARVDAEMKYW